MNNNLTAWLHWIGSRLVSIDADARVRVPAWLPPPQSSGFSKPWMAEPHGQVADFVLPLADGTRVHIHEMGDGRLLAHRENNPGHSLLSALVHFFGETFIGRAVVVGAGVSLLLDASTPKRRRRS